jgi:hypothetical protein
MITMMRMMHMAPANPPTAYPIKLTPESGVAIREMGSVVDAPSSVGGKPPKNLRLSDEVRVTDNKN